MSEPEFTCDRHKRHDPKCHNCVRCRAYFRAGRELGRDEVRWLFQDALKLSQRGVLEVVEKPKEGGRG